MGLIPKVTCRRCGHKYSSLRQRCPKCNIRRVRQSSRVPGTTPEAVKGTAANARVAENRKWQLIFGAILIVAVIAAFIAMITVGVSDEGSHNTPARPDVPELSAQPTPDGGGNTDVPTPQDTPEITQLQIFYYSEDKTDSGFAATVGSKTPLLPRWYPQNLLDVEYSWSSSDEAVATIGDDGVVVAVGTGTCTITLTCYGQTAQCTVYVRG